MEEHDGVFDLVMRLMAMSQLTLLDQEVFSAFYGLSIDVFQEGFSVECVVLK